VALKIVSPDVVHKTEVGGVRVGVPATDVAAAYDEMLGRVTAALPNARISGVLVQEMITAGCETIVGMTRDASFGPLVMFGLGGVLVEALHDVVFRIAPISDGDACAMLASIRGAKLLDGVRGAPAADRRSIVSVIRRIGQLSVDFPEIAELDVNPLLAGPRSAIALDARVAIASPV
jgi:hypothetical protein